MWKTWVNTYVTMFLHLCYLLSYGKNCNGMETSFQFAKPISQVEIDIQQYRKNQSSLSFSFFLKSCKRFFFKKY